MGARIIGIATDYELTINLNYCIKLRTVKHNASEGFGIFQYSLVV